jgi:hypothetical protein
MGGVPVRAKVPIDIEAPTQPQRIRKPAESTTSIGLAVEAIRPL